MRFIRHLIAVCVVITAICAATLLSGLGGRPEKSGIFCPHGCDPRSLGLRPNDPSLRRLPPGPLGGQTMHLDWGNLIQTVVLGTVVALLVVALDMAVRRRRRTLRLKPN